MVRFTFSCGPALLACLAACDANLSALRAEEPVRLEEKFPAGYQYHVNTRVDLSGSVTLPAEKGKPTPNPITISGDSAIEYDERVLTLDNDGRVQKTARVYRKMDFQRKVGDKPQQASLRPEVRKVVLLLAKNRKGPFSPDGPLTWGEIDLIRTDVFAPTLTGLLPEKAVQIDDRWKATEASIKELTDMEKIDEGEVECRLEQFTALEKRRHARVAFSGTVRGVNEDGPTKQHLTGYYYFDLESNHLSYLFLKGVNSLIDKDGKEVGRVEGRFTLTRQANQRSKDLGDEALKSWSLDPNAENTLLLYDNPDLGVRFLYPRRWKVAGGLGRQVDLDGSDGSGLRITLETAETVPTAKQYLTESRDFLQGQKAKILGLDAPRRLQDAPRELDQFLLDVEIGKDRVTMSYYVARQAKGGATLAARLPTSDLAALKKEVDAIARSLVITRVIEVEKPKAEPGKE
jgi:hypothetical protein